MSQVELKTTIYSEEAGETLQAPITEGDILGEAEVYIGNTSYGKINLVANTTIELDKTKYMKLEIHNALTNKYVKLVIVALIALVVIYIIFIIVYNINRSKKKKMADALAKRRIEEVMRGESISSGKSFEEIVEMKNRHDEMTRK
jgi:flagellar biosynthesis/type III secretory pathway M-ring protein FliF/YscJ